MSSPNAVGPQAVGRVLIDRQKTLACAESCTGGHLAAEITSIPDASKYFLGSLVVYSNRLKTTLLGVAPATLLERGAVSGQTAHEMWLGLMQVTGADVGVATTGIAGPSGGTSEQPVGTVFIAVGSKGQPPRIVRYQCKGGRKQVVAEACRYVFQELAALINQSCPS